MFGCQSIVENSLRDELAPFLMLAMLDLQGLDSRIREWTNFFFRPTPYGFRQVVQHVSKHVAYGIN